MVGLYGVHILLIRIRLLVWGFLGVLWFGMLDVIELYRLVVLLVINHHILLLNQGTVNNFFMVICRSLQDGIEGNQVHF